MKAERDEDDFPRNRGARKVQERRLAYEIALGIIIGGLVLGVVNDIHDYVMAKVMMGQIQIQIPQ
ncbi:hypothetical protein [Metapseudomonas otitidis]|uniref:hypothetical protein n=1 Tax=Metapseudomonas otitidis TaxID=319939 RepID=UPI00262E517A|nr:hypothetical protein [Pseudomonas otitidis]